MEMQRGFRGKLSDWLNLTEKIWIQVELEGPGEYDVSLFGLDESGTLSDERYMIFYNQTSAPFEEIRMTGKQGFEIDFQKLPPFLVKMSLTVNCDSGQTMGEVKKVRLQIGQKGKQETLVLSMTGADFQKEKAIILAEFYQKSEWRANAVASGFNGGLSELLKLYGGVEAEETPQKEVRQEAAAPDTKISLEKKLQRAPELLSLAKPIQVCLEKKQLASFTARVALVLDMSGSMKERYRNGTVQDIVNKILPLAVQFDDDGALDFWYYGKIAKRMQDVTLENYRNTVPPDWEKLMHRLGIINNEPAVMKEIINEYKKSKIPAYVVFINDGGVGSKNKIKELLLEASNYPIFWQFVGVGGAGYGILEELDTLRGRVVDNANFFALDDFRTVSAQELYDRLLAELPIWAREAKRLRIY